MHVLSYYTLTRNLEHIAGDHNRHCSDMFESNVCKAFKLEIDFSVDHDLHYMNYNSPGTGAERLHKPSF